MSQIEPVKKAYRFKTKSDDYVYIGDLEDVEFHPKLTLNRWVEECRVKLVFDDSKVKEKSCKLEENKVKWEAKREGFAFRLYPSEPRKVIMKHPQTGETLEFLQNELGGLEFEIILKKKPASNQFILSIDTQNLKFYYQPPLHHDHPTWADTDGDGVADSFRPENVVGSYAVYHATRTNMHRSKEDAEKYKTGKAFHIYRPKAVDAEGNEAWCDLDIDEVKGFLTVSIPQEFLDKALYPVMMDPTFGYEDLGGTNLEISAEELYGSAFPSPSDVETADSISVYVTSQAAGYLKGVLVLNSNLNIVQNGVCNPEKSAIGWCTTTFPTSPNLSPNTDYVLCAIWNGAPNWLKYDTGETDQGLYDSSNSYLSPSDPTDATRDTKKYSIYCTYTAAAPPPPPVEENPLISKPLVSPIKVGKPLIR